MIFVIFEFWGWGDGFEGYDGILLGGGVEMWWVSCYENVEF